MCIACATGAERAKMSKQIDYLSQGQPYNSEALPIGYKTQPSYKPQNQTY